MVKQKEPYLMKDMKKYGDKTKVTIEVDFVLSGGLKDFRNVCKK